MLKLQKAGLAESSRNRIEEVVNKLRSMCGRSQQVIHTLTDLNRQTSLSVKVLGR